MYYIHILVQIDIGIVPALLCCITIVQTPASPIAIGTQMHIIRSLWGIVKKEKETELRVEKSSRTVHF